jgi:2-polyprenyl-3-methyl-5-hydroxy-6-metoxy-1,4-benzoquinol methylase
MDEYLKINRAAYEQLAHRYNKARFNKYIGFHPRIIEPFECRVKHSFGKSPKVLDVGCGMGITLKILSDHGFKTYGIDFSPKATLIARGVASHAEIITGNFLTKQFSMKFHGITMISFFHLFPKMMYIWF